VDKYSAIQLLQTYIVELTREAYKGMRRKVDSTEIKDSTMKRKLLHGYYIIC
jgi:hypothetical protein